MPLPLTKCSEETSPFQPAMTSGVVEESAGQQTCGENAVGSPHSHQCQSGIQDLFRVSATSAFSTILGPVEECCTSAQNTGETFLLYSKKSVCKINSEDNQQQSLRKSMVNERVLSNEDANGLEKYHSQEKNKMKAENYLHYLIPRQNANQEIVCF